MKITPNITVLMPAYNAEKYIGEAITSVLQQTYTDFELVIVNDGSTDGTVAIINSFNDERIVLINQSNRGVADALNTGLKYARAPYIARFDADDICYPYRLEKQIRFLQDNPEYILVGSEAKYILENGDFLFDFHCIAYSHEQIMAKLYFYCPFVHPAVMYKKAAVLNAGGYPTHAHNFEDYLLWTNLVNQGLFCNLTEPLIKYRLNSSSVTIDEKWRGRRFRELKRGIVLRGSITAAEGNELLAIIRDQDVRKIKEGAYNSLCGKKFLTANHQPERARNYFNKAIKIYPLRFENYLLYLLSYFPESIITWLHKLSPNRL
ncbi:glycosyltransferase [Mucilaginibacter sp. UR6-11]|uniref:glycosyltransferase n=1 Tax=Mucilaginibacter sp. UR6-11 TaxID=1435644 RepID=UPI001E4CE864|nr:glycosyltransferase [Mucilaginibacter sp. UR6-11]MCC8427146.1 glycosyltransferase [Mucilaginibacter sp. UR6-11]